MTGVGDPVLPLHLDLRGRRVVVVGGGPVAARKVTAAAAAGAAVSVISPDIETRILQLVHTGQVSWERARYRSGQLAGAWLAVAATDSAVVNGVVAEEAEQRRIFCIRADRGPAGSARSAATFRRTDGVLVGVTTCRTDRANPALARRVRDLVAAGLVEN